MALCRGCHSWYADGYLYRHHNSNPKCLALTIELERESQHMKEDVEEESKTDSKAVTRIMAQQDSDQSTVEEDEHSTVLANKRARPNYDVFGKTTSVEKDIDDAWNNEAEEPSTPGEVGVAAEEEQEDPLAEEEAEMEIAANWEAFDGVGDFWDESEDDEPAKDDFENVDEEKQLMEAEEEEEEEEEEGVAEQGSQLSQDDKDALMESFQGIFESHQRHLKKPHAPMNNREKAAVRLLKILKQAKAPLYVYDEIVKWAIKAAVNGVFTDLSTKKLPTKKNTGFRSLPI